MIVFIIIGIEITIINALLEDINTPGYEIVRFSESYIRDGRQGIAYSVVVDPEITDSGLKLVFRAVTKDDKYPLHCVWFFSSEQRIEEAWGYDVAMIVDETGSAKLTRK